MGQWCSTNGKCILPFGEGHYSTKRSGLGVEEGCILQRNVIRYSVRRIWAMMFLASPTERPECNLLL